MNAAEIRTYFAFNRWANDRILASCRVLGDDEFTRNLHNSHGGIRGTLVHTLWGEWVWYRRWIGESPKTIFEESEFADIAAIEHGNATRLIPTLKPA